LAFFARTLAFLLGFFLSTNLGFFLTFLKDLDTMILRSMTKKSRQQKFRAMNKAHLASPIRGELGYGHRPQFGSQIAYWKPNLGPLGKEDVCPNFALTVGNICV